MRRVLIATLLAGLVAMGGTVASADTLTIDPVTGFPIMVPDTETRVSRLEQQVGDLTKQLSALLARLEATETKLTATESTAKNLDARILGLESQLSQAKTRITNLESQVAALTAAPAPAPTTSTGSTSGTTTGTTGSTSGTSTTSSTGSTGASSGTTSTGTTAPPASGSTGNTGTSPSPGSGGQSSTGTQVVVGLPKRAEVATSGAGTIGTMHQVVVRVVDANGTLVTPAERQAAVKLEVQGTTAAATSLYLADGITTDGQLRAWAQTVQGVATFYVRTSAPGTLTYVAQIVESTGSNDQKSATSSGAGTSVFSAAPNRVALTGPNPGSITGNGSSIAQVSAQLLDEAGNPATSAGRFRFSLDSMDFAFLQGAASDGSLTVSTATGSYTAILQAQSVQSAGTVSVTATFIPDNPAQTLPGGSSASATMTVTAP